MHKCLIMLYILVRIHVRILNMLIALKIVYSCLRSIVNNVNLLNKYVLNFNKY